MTERRLNQTEFAPRDTHEAVLSVMEHPRIIKITGALGASCLAKLASFHSQDGLYDGDPSDIHEVVYTELPELYIASEEFARTLNSQNTGIMHASCQPITPLLMRSARSSPHVDSFHYTNESYINGPLTHSLGVSGSARFRDYGLVVSQIPLEQMTVADTTRAITRGIRLAVDDIDSIESVTVTQDPGDIVIIPAMPYPLLHEVDLVTEGRLGIVMAHVWVDGTKYDPENPDDIEYIRLQSIHRLLRNRHAPPRQA